MAVGAFTAVVGFAGARSAKRSARAATALSAAQQRQTTDETIRRQEYTHERDISDIEAEIAASGMSSTGAGLRGGEKRTTSSFDTEISNLEAEMEGQTSAFGAGFGLSSSFGRSDDDDDDDDDDEDSATRVREAQERSIEYQDNADKLESLKIQRQQELDLPWNPEGGMFSEYLTERGRVQISEIEWMRRTGLSNLASIYAEGQSAQAAARAAGTGYLTKLVGAAANWWESSQEPTNTTTTAQTEQ